MNKVRAVALKQKGLMPILIVIILAAAALGGYFIYQNQPKPTPSPQPSPLSTEAPAKVEDPTANWKTDQLEKLQYKIPSNWWSKGIALEETRMIIVGIHPTSLEETPNIAPLLTLINTYDSTIDKQKHQFIKENVLNVENENNIEISGVHGIRIEGVTAGGRYKNTKIQATFLNYDNDVYYYITNTSKSGTDKETIDQIISTFKFTQ